MCLYSLRDQYELVSRCHSRASLIIWPSSTLKECWKGQPWRRLDHPHHLKEVLFVLKISCVTGQQQHRSSRLPSWPNSPAGALLTNLFKMMGNTHWVSDKTTFANCYSSWAIRCVLPSLRRGPYWMHIVPKQKCNSEHWEAFSNSQTEFDNICNDASRATLRGSLMKSYVNIYEITATAQQFHPDQRNWCQLNFHAAVIQVWQLLIK